MPGDVLLYDVSLFTVPVNMKSFEGRKKEEKVKKKKLKKVLALAKKMMKKKHTRKDKVC